LLAKPEPQVTVLSRSVQPLGVRGRGEVAANILRRRIPTHPFAVPPIVGTFGVWQVRRDRDSPLGYVLSRHELGGFAFHGYAPGRDDGDGRPWLHREDSLNSAVAWMIQHERDLSALTGRLHPEPDEWPS
jgi:hypothetical protein